MKLVSTFSFVLLAGLLASPAHAAGFRGKCAKQALNAAVTKWADVPNPSETLEYIPVSSEPVKAGSDTYVVVLALSDGNEMAYAKYEVVFGDYARCAKPVVTAKN